MPGRWGQVGIVGFWLVMMGWLVWRDVLPRLGMGELRYRAVLADRAVAEPTNWRLLYGERRVGNLFSMVEPKPDGGYVLSTRGHLSGAELRPEDDSPLSELLRAAKVGADRMPDFEVRSQFKVTALGRLAEFSVAAGVRGLGIDLVVEGTVEGNELVLESKGLSFLAGQTRLPFDSEAVVLDQFGPMDRIAGLSVGKVWTTRAVNPLAALLAPRGWLGARGTTLDTMRHEVIGEETIVWNRTEWRCYVVEHEHPGSPVRAQSWVRIGDGKVLREEIPLGGDTISLEPEPAAE